MLDGVFSGGASAPPLACLAGLPGLPSDLLVLVFTFPLVWLLHSTFQPVLAVLSFFASGVLELLLRVSIGAAGEGCCSHALRTV